MINLLVCTAEPGLFCGHGYPEGSRAEQQLHKGAVIHLMNSERREFKTRPRPAFPGISQNKGTDNRTLLSWALHACRALVAVVAPHILLGHAADDRFDLGVHRP